MNFLKVLALSLIAGGGISAGVALVSEPAGFSAGVWLLASLSTFLLVKLWQWAGGGRLLGIQIGLGFFLRLAIGVVLFAGLPVWGYDEPGQQAGYIFLDAYERDRQAWGLAQTSDPVWTAFTEEFRTDQYGGLLALSALVYRALSPAVHQPLIIMVLAAFIVAAGIPFLYRASKTLWGPGVSAAAVWIYTLYPESLLLGASQMREPFIMGFSAVAFWAVLDRDADRRNRLATALAALLGLTLISSRVTIPVVTVLAGVYLLARDIWPATMRQRIFWLVGGTAIAAVLVWYGYSWLHESALWDAVLTTRGSGWMQLLVEVVGKRMRVPLVTLYGLTQPVLPGAVIEPASPFAHVISTFRAVGWYAIAPIIVYAPLAAFQIKAAKERRILLWLAFAVIAWIVIASLRAGGDVWDNPRYRTHFMIWIALVVAWGWQWARETRSTWLPRFYLIEGIFLAFLTIWYLGRYPTIIPLIRFTVMLSWIAGLSLLVVIVGLWRDRTRSSVPAGTKKQLLPRRE